MTQSKKIIIFIIILLIASSAFLFGVERYYKNTTGGNWWAVYFNDSKSKDLDFIIENHGTSADFAWELWLGDKKVGEGKETIAEKDKKIIETTQGLGVAFKGRANVKVSSGEEKREIHKNLR